MKKIDLCESCNEPIETKDLIQIDFDYHVHFCKCMMINRFIKIEEKMKKTTRLRLFVAILIAVIAVTGYLIKDKLPNSASVSEFEKYCLYR